MKKWCKNLRIIALTFRKDLFLILILCFCFVILYDFWFIDIKEVFRGASKLGRVFYGLSLSYISAYIFYFLNIFIRSQKEEKEVNHYVARKVSQILIVTFVIIRDLENASSIKIKGKFPDKSELDAMTTKIKTTDMSNLKSRDGNYATWPIYLDYHKLMTEDYINKIISRINFIDTKLVRILSEIEDSMLFLKIQHKALWEKSSSDLYFLSSELYDYFMLNKELENYYENKLRIYLKG